MKIIYYMIKELMHGTGMAAMFVDPTLQLKLSSALCLEEALE
jgi:hypothetical protein